MLLAVSLTTCKSTTPMVKVYVRHKLGAYMSDVALQDIPSESVNSAVSPAKPRRIRDKIKTRAYMTPYLALYRIDHKIAKKDGLTVGQWRRRQKAHPVNNVARETS